MAASKKLIPSLDEQKMDKHSNFFKMIMKYRPDLQVGQQAFK
jgi:hypothetical protein